MPVIGLLSKPPTKFNSRNLLRPSCKPFSQTSRRDAPSVLINERFVAKNRVSPVSQIENLSLPKLQYGYRSFSVLMKKFLTFGNWGAYRAHGVKVDEDEKV